jgi:hypothetical protein
MKQWFLISRRQTTTRISKDELVDLLPDYEDKSGNRCSGEWLYVVKGRLYKNRIGFSAKPGEYEVTHKRYIRWYWPALLLISTLGLILTHSLQSAFEFRSSKTSALLFLIFLCILACVVCSFMMTRAGPMKSFWTQTESQVMRPPFQLFGVVMVLLLVTIFVDLSTSVLGVVALIALIGFYWRNEEFFVKRAKIRNTTSMRALGVRPIVTSYLIFLVVISMQLTLFIWWSLFSGFFKLLVEDRLFFTGYLLTSSVTWSIIVFANQQYHFNLEKYNFDSKYISSEGVVRRFLCRLFSRFYRPSSL